MSHTTFLTEQPTKNWSAKFYKSPFSYQKAFLIEETYLRCRSLYKIKQHFSYKSSRHNELHP